MASVLGAWAREEHRRRRREGEQALQQAAGPVTGGLAREARGHEDDRVAPCLVKRDELARDPLRLAEARIEAVVDERPERSIVTEPSAVLLLEIPLREEEGESGVQGRVVDVEHDRRGFQRREARSEGGQRDDARPAGRRCRRGVGGRRRLGARRGGGRSAGRRRGYGPGGEDPRDPTRAHPTSGAAKRCDSSYGPPWLRRGRRPPKR